MLGARYSPGMAIFDRAPTDWRDLQNLTGQLFSEMGCEVEVGKVVKLVRGQKEVDVWVQDPSTSPPSRYLTECKFWEGRVDQEVVHSFRTVVADYGAHRGFIVSKTGFQSGAREAARDTNVDLLTFDELQQVFERRWRETMVRALKPLCDVLFPFWDPTGGVAPKGAWGPSELEAHRLITDACMPYIYLDLVVHQDGRLGLPVTVPIIGPGYTKRGELVLRTYREFFEYVLVEHRGLHQMFAGLHGVKTVNGSAPAK